MKQKLFRCFLTLIVALGSFAQSFAGSYTAAYDYDFSDTDYYNNLCSNTGLSDEQREMCLQYRQYVQEQIDAMQSQIDETQANMAAIKADIANQVGVINDLNDRISSVEGQIAATEASITKISDNIVELQGKIAETQKHIDDLNTQIKGILVANQPYISSNSYITFIMGASSFVDLIRRISALNEFTSYDMKKLDELDAAKQQLQDQEADLQSQKDNLIQQQNDLEVLKSSLETMRSQAQELLVAYRARQSELNALLEEQTAVSSGLNDLAGEIDKALDNYIPSDGWIYPLTTQFYVTSACFYYEQYAGSGFHPAVDLSAPYGSDVVATANGYVVATYMGCGYGWLGCQCASGHGNYVVYIVEIGGQCYEVISQHLSAVYVAEGDMVKAGEAIGALGSSGNSSGPHLHQVVIRMEPDLSIKQAVQSFLDRGRYYYGLGYNIYSACPVKGYAPCYEDAEDIYGTYYHHAYNY
jgi:murein DD-endopeptidase MepM/ murein hydrolase activator NlpD